MESLWNAERKGTVAAMSVTKGGDGVSPGCSNTVLIFLRKAEGLHSGVCLLLLHTLKEAPDLRMPECSSDSWSLMATATGVINSVEDITETGRSP